MFNLIHQYDSAKVGICDAMRKMKSFSLSRLQKDHHNHSAFYCNRKYFLRVQLTIELRMIAIILSCKILHYVTSKLVVQLMLLPTYCLLRYCILLEISDSCSNSYLYLVIRSLWLVHFASYIREMYDMMTMLKWQYSYSK